VKDGHPVVFLHGWPSSNREQFASDTLLAKLRLDWFSPNRPGYGETTWQQEHGLLDWPARLGVWADELGLDRFHLVGYSGGGPFAMACAQQSPERLFSLTLIASLAPQHGPWKPIHSLLLRRTPALTHAGFRLLGGYRKRFPHRFAKRAFQLLHPKDQTLLNALDFFPTLLEVQNDAFAQGTAHLVRDLQLYEGPWGFDPAEIQVPTRLYVGSEDVQVPAACSYWLAERIPEAKLTIYNGEAHYIPFTHAEEILAAIVIP
jgi:pimeloyl-ACP methyl ester carboxylesterase